MTNTLNKLIALLWIALSIPNVGAAQNGLTPELRYEVNRVYPHISISTAQLTDAHSLADLDVNYKSGWVRNYISVVVFTTCKGAKRTAFGKNNILSQEQKENMSMADLGTDISIKVRYMPENTLRHNDIQEMDFTFTVNPENDAQYSGGQQQLKQYLKEKSMDKISDTSFKKSDLAAIKFTVNETGKIIYAHVLESSKDEKTDALLLETIRNMPNWKPAAYADGTTVKQDFVLTVGNMESCVINLLNIRQH